MDSEEARKTALRDSLRNAFTEDPEDGRLKLALLKEDFKYREWFPHFLEWYEQTNDKAGKWPLKKLRGFGLVQLHLFATHPFWKHVLALVDPCNGEDACPAHIASYILARLFCTRAVQGIYFRNRSDDEAASGYLIETFLKRGLKPSERLLIVDLTEKKCQIMKEFEEFYDRARLKNKGEKWWNRNGERRRKENWTHLKVWKLRRERKPFSEIARALKITPDAAKKSFYRAYELTQRTMYIPEALRKDVWTVKKSEIKVLCDVCPKFKTCKDMCPDVLRYANQDATTQRDKLLSDPSMIEKLW